VIPELALRALALLEAPDAELTVTVDQVVAIFRAVADVALTPGERTTALHIIVRARQATPAWNGLHSLGHLCQGHTHERQGEERAAFARLARVCVRGWRAQASASGRALARKSVEEAPR
jgi:hypothetical protein